MEPLFHRLQLICPVDGRYGRYTEPLGSIFSEMGLIKYRTRVEASYLQALSRHPLVPVRTFSRGENRFLNSLHNLTLDQVIIVKAIETKGYGKHEKTNHDVKAVEYFFKDELEATSLSDVMEWVHFALTSEDVNNLSYALMLGDGVAQVLLPLLDRISKKLRLLAKKFSRIPMLGVTHGQPASPTTLGKEFRVFKARLDRELKYLRKFRIRAKLNGATGNFNAHQVAFPDVDWRRFSKNFINQFNRGRAIKLQPNLITTQIESHDTLAELFGILMRINTIIIDCSTDMWEYISRNWLVQIPEPGTTGSSTMPHKVNPIDFENAEGRAGLANALLGFFCQMLPVSRLQRHLSDSTVSREFGVAFGDCVIAYNSLLKGLSKIDANPKQISYDLEHHPEVIAEAVQTVLRAEGYPLPYEALKALTKGKRVTLHRIHKFINKLQISRKVRSKLLKITPSNYIGLAVEIAEQEGE